MLNPGDTVDRFTVESVLGEGGLAIVFRVRHNTLGSLHAFKLLKFQGDAIQKRLVMEGQVQASLRHPNIVAVTDVVFFGERPGLVLEFIDGPSLESWLATHEPTVEEAEVLFSGILAGVARAHRAGLVHRDLKPGNILLDSTDGAVTPKVTDFGIAKALADEGNRSHTRTGVAMGTPQFMAPEQIRSTKDVDQRADIWALGCILYQLVTGRLPFDADDIIELYSSIGAGRYIAPEKLVPSLPPRVGDAIRGCLTVDLERRIPDCETLRQVLGAPTAEVTVTGTQRIGSTLSRALPTNTPWKVPDGTRPAPDTLPLVGARTQDEAPESVGPSAAPIAGALEIDTWGEAQEAPRTPKKPPVRAESRRLGLIVGLVGLAGLALVSGAAGVYLLLSRQEAARPPEVAPLVPPIATSAPAASSEGPAVAPREEPAATKPELVSAPVKAASLKASAPSAKPAHAETAHAETAATAASAEPTPSTGRVAVSGEVQSVVLRSGSKSRSTGQVPVGTYTATVTFAGRDPIEVPAFEVGADETVTLVCNAAFVNCRVSR